MELFFHTQRLQLLIFCIDNQEFVANLDYVCFVFFCNIIIIVNHFLYCFIILLHLVSSFLQTESLLVPCAYVPIESINCILSSSLALNAFQEIHYVHINVSINININLLFFINSLLFSLRLSTSTLLFFCWCNLFSS